MTDLEPGLKAAHSRRGRAAEIAGRGWARIRCDCERNPRPTPTQGAIQAPHRESASNRTRFGAVSRRGEPRGCAQRAAGHAPGSFASTSAAWGSWALPYLGRGVGPTPQPPQRKEAMRS